MQVIHPPDQAAIPIETSNVAVGVLIVNTGTPDAPTPSAIRRYLAEFLSDRRVISIPYYLWWPILHGYVLRRRPQLKVKDYQKIWTENGSPLLLNTRAQAEQLQLALNKHVDSNITVSFAMRYGTPSIKQALLAFKQKSVNKILILPLFPQYSMTTTASVFDAVIATIQKWPYLPETRMINHYGNDPGYINALAIQVQNSQQMIFSNYLIFSFHGLPKSFINQGDPYYQQCITTAKLVAHKIGLPQNKWSVAFQSRIGPTQWLQPYTDEVLKNLAQRGIKQVTVMCPGFASDCLETLEEIAITYKTLFEKYGGEKFYYIPALNASSHHIEALTQIIQRHLLGWCNV